MQILHCFSRSRKNSLLYSFKFHWSYYILFQVWLCATFLMTQKCSCILASPVSSKILIINFCHQHIELPIFLFLMLLSVKLSLAFILPFSVFEFNVDALHESFLQNSHNVHFGLAQNRAKNRNFFCFLDKKSVPKRVYIFGKVTLKGVQLSLILII